MKRYRHTTNEYGVFSAAMMEDASGSWVMYDDAVKYAEEIETRALQLVEAQNSQFIKIIDDREHVHLIRKSDVLRIHKYNDENFTWVEIYENSGTMNAKKTILRTKQTIDELHALL